MEVAGGKTMKLSVGQQEHLVTSGHDLDQWIAYIREMRSADVAIWIQDGPSLTMLRSDVDAMLMYLRFVGDSGFVGVGDHKRSGTVDYVLANGQVDSYPAAWSLDVDTCLEAIRAFVMSDGKQPPMIDWIES
jgi:hypothetical protein